MDTPETQELRRAITEGFLDASREIQEAQKREHRQQLQEMVSFWGKRKVEAWLDLCIEDDDER